MQPSINFKQIVRNYKLQNTLLTALFLICTTILFGQKLEPKERAIQPDTTITSKIMGKDYQLYISFPRDYSTDDTITYPVLYVLDGKGSFPVFNAARGSMDKGNELEKVIIVGIGSGLTDTAWYINRMYDYTPSQDTVFDRKTEKQLGFPKGSVQSGGAQKFLQCITTEIIPFIDTYCKTTHQRGITGHSLGGLFTAYSLLNAKDVFNRFGVNSPSLWWNNNEILNRADSLISKNENLFAFPAKIFISVGQNEGPKMVPGMVKFSTLLEAKSYKNIKLTWHLFTDETHLSVLPACLSRTLKVLYGKEE